MIDTKRIAQAASEYQGVEVITRVPVEQRFVCTRCREPFPRDGVIVRTNGYPICHKCREDVLEIDREKKINQYLHRVIDWVVDHQAKNDRKGVEDIRSADFAKSFYRDFGGPSSYGSLVAQHFRTMIDQNPGSVAVSRVLVSMQQCLRKIEDDNKEAFTDADLLSDEDLHRQMTQLALEAMASAMHAMSVGELEDAATLLSEIVSTTEARTIIETVADEIGQGEGIPKPSHYRAFRAEPHLPEEELNGHRYERKPEGSDAD